MGKEHKVLIMRCGEYDPEKIHDIIKTGMQELNVTPAGNILLKPNVVIAHPKVFPFAFTRSEFLEGAISAVKEKAENAKEISVGERSGITIPTRFAFKMAGYNEVIKRQRIKSYYFDESNQVRFKLQGRDRLRDTLFIPKPIIDCDFLINLPKFKAHPWCRLTLSLKNFIGIQDDRHRLVDHNTYLEHKIADLQEVIQPKFIAIDAITAGQRMMLTPTPFPMGAILMGTNSCAVDTVACHMVNVDPNDLIHLRMASERGFGPMNLDEIEVAGDFPLKEVQEKTGNFEFCMEYVNDYFKEDCKLRCTVGKFPAKHSTDYCWGGCPGALQESMHILKAYYPNVYTEMGKIHYVVGKIGGALDIMDDEKVIFMGDCTSWEGEIDDEHVKIEANYKQPSEVDEKKTRSNDMIFKTIKTLWACFKNRKKKYIHVKGCTVSVGDHVHYLSFFGKTRNPNFDLQMIIPLNIAYFKMRMMRFLNRFG